MKRKGFEVIVFLSQKPMWHIIGHTKMASPFAHKLETSTSFVSSHSTLLLIAKHTVYKSNVTVCVQILYIQQISKKHVLTIYFISSFNY